MWTLLATAIISSCITSFIISDKHNKIHKQMDISEYELNCVNKAIHRVESNLYKMNEELDKSIALRNCNK